MGKKERKKKQERSSRLAQREHKGQWAQANSRSAADRGLQHLERGGPDVLLNMQMALESELWDDLSDFHFSPEEVEEMTHLIGPLDLKAAMTDLGAYVEYVERRRGFQETQALRERLQRLLPHYGSRPDLKEAIETMLGLLQVEALVIWALLALYCHTLASEAEMEEEEAIEEELGYAQAPGVRLAPLPSSLANEYCFDDWLQGLRDWAHRSSRSPCATLEPALVEEVQRAGSPLRLPPEVLLFAPLNWLRRSESGRTPDDFSEDDWEEWLPAVLFEADLESQYAEVHTQLGEALRRRAEELAETSQEERAELLAPWAEEWLERAPDENPLLHLIYIESLLEFDERLPQTDVERALQEMMEAPWDLKAPIRLLLQMARAGQAESAVRLLPYLQATHPEQPWQEVSPLLEEPEAVQRWLKEQGLAVD